MVLTASSNRGSERMRNDIGCTRHICTGIPKTHVRRGESVEFILCIGSRNQQIQVVKRNAYNETLNEQAGGSRISDPGPCRSHHHLQLWRQLATCVSSQSERCLTCAVRIRRRPSARCGHPDSRSSATLGNCVLACARSSLTEWGTVANASL